MPLLPAQLLHNRYRIDKLLGQGGMGAVYDAWDNNLGVRCAVKENLNFTDASQRQFEREARLLATLHHQHLPNVFDHFIIPGQGQYLVMRYVEGEDLSQRLARLGPMPEADVLRWADEVLNALAYLHKRNIIHRDIKPANIKITPDGEAMLVDFGIAKEYEAAGETTTTGARGLTPGFAPPEQYGLARTDARSDLYSLGATLYVMLTGQVPADAWSRMQHPEKFVPLSRRAAGLPPHTAAAIDRALEMQPEDRFASADEMRTALRTEPEKTSPVIPLATTTRKEGATFAPTIRSVDSQTSRLPAAKSPARLFPAIAAAAGVMVVGAFAVVAVAGYFYFIRSAASTTPSQHPSSPTASALQPTALPSSSFTGTPSSTQTLYESFWSASAHADQTAEAFIHWDADNPPEIPTACAKCHSTPGFLDFIGADGSAVNVVDQPAAPRTLIGCDVCHNTAAAKMTSVIFPSGIEIANLGPEARCMQCHQGRAWGGTVDSAIQEAGVVDDDQPAAELAFSNIHYFAAAATLEGTFARGGYEYPGKLYDASLTHVDGYATCVGCHDPHSLKIKVDECAACHTGVKSAEDLKNVRMVGSLVDYDGDGNATEGIAFEIDGLREKLYQAMRTYAQTVPQTPIAYSLDVYPYFFVDVNDNGQVEENEALADNRYNSWTGRLTKAAYNYQTSLKDPGAFAHGGKYIIELLYDSIEDLNTRLRNPIDLSKAHRADPGHFSGAAVSFRNWDADGEVPAACAKCHAAGGLPEFLANGANLAGTPGNGLQCSTCHEGANNPARYAVLSVTFPSGKAVSLGGRDANGNFIADDANLCLMCHQGRESKVSIDKALSGFADADKPDDSIRFRHIHYNPAGATLFGSDVRGAYEFDGRSYAGQNTGHPLQTCVECHDSHALSVKVDVCGSCHAQVKDAEDARKIRLDTTDYDGDGNTTEGIYDELSTVRDRLYEVILAYAERKGTPIVYDAAAYPFFFVDANRDGQRDVNDQGASIAYNAWSPKLLKSAYNYHYLIKEPGAFAHNPKYAIEIVYDSIENLDRAGVAGMTRP